MTGKREIDPVSGTETTGHEWDGIKELNNPMPRWWLGIFYATIVWAIGYWILMPSWPLISGYTTGLLQHSQRENVSKDIAELKQARAAHEKVLRNATLDQIRSDPNLLQFALAEGRASFGDNCAGCHGTGAQGFKGYPNLNDDVWLWGGSLEDIQGTISVGVRSTHAQTRTSQMPAFGTGKILNPTEINDLTEYVVQLSGRPANAASVRRAARLYSENCASCHGASGAGDRKLGAPKLTDAEWLYGGERADIKAQIWNGRGGAMPTWNGRLTGETIKSLAIYVHSLGGGE